MPLPGGVIAGAGIGQRIEMISASQLMPVDPHLTQGVTMRLTPIAPADLTPEQRALYNDMREGIAKSFKGFIAVREDGALLGPWNPWLT